MQSQTSFQPPAESPFDVDGRVGLITGGSGGIGKAIANALARAGVSIAIADKAIDQRTDAILENVRAMGCRAMAVQVDVTNASDVHAMVSKVVQELGPVDILVNGAGFLKNLSILEMSVEEWNRMINVHVTGSVLCTQAVLPQMLERHRGVIINISSQTGQKGAPQATHYSAAKGALIAMTRALAREVGSQGVRVNAVAPGVVATDLIRPVMTADWVAEKVQPMLTGRFGEPEEIAAVVLFLVSRAAELFNGQTLSPNAGTVMP